jgi:hypothetical protein
VPSFLDAHLSDVLEETRAAELYAPTGTRNFWPAEMTAYMGGSDHDLFLGVGVPATMLGHDPDWTHHTSEDTPDKTDASEFLRVGVLAASGAWFIAAADDASWQRLATAVAAEQLRADGARLVGMRLAGNERLANELQRRVSETAAHLAGARLAADGTLVAPATTTTTARKGTGPRRLVIPPADSTPFETLTGDDRAWFEAEKEKREQFELMLYETMSLLDGRRATGEIADALTMELGQEVPEAWVARLLAILAKLKLVAL